jgi:HK97 family phage prohead protease
MATEIRSFNCELRTAPDDEMALVGYAARFDQESCDLPSGASKFTEIIKPGAFTKVLKTNPDVRCLFNHSADHVLARTASGTLKLEQDDRGLRFRAQLDPMNTAHRNLHSSVKRGDISECSFGFALDDGDDDWSQKSGENIRTIRNISHLFDVSIVTNPAYKGTSVAARAAVSDSTCFGPQGEPLIVARPPIAINEMAVLRAQLARQKADIEMDLRMNKIVATALRNKCSVADLEDAELRLRVKELGEQIDRDEE